MIIIDEFIQDEALLQKIQHSQEFWKLGYHWWNGWWNTERKSIRHELIEYIYRYHSPLNKSVSLDGFEHWVGIQKPNDITTNDAGDWSLVTHFDKDEKLWEKTGEIVTPKLGTIFYPDPCNDEMEGGYLMIWKTHSVDFNAPHELIEAKYNRLIIFDASQLHAVTPVTKGIRKAIAINLWDEAPSDAPNMLF